jgi:ubiquinone/menaquinone biosynthesis C-methylase UbiE
MTVKIDQPAEVGEYDEGMQSLLQLVWGDGFLSPGGADEVARVLEGVDLRGRRVLDIGCGLGGIDVLLVRDHHAAAVVGIDLEPGLVRRARERFASAGLADRIEAHVVQAGPFTFADGSFDVVFSKDSLVQIPDKRAIFAEVRRVLRPGGLLVMSDWLRGGEGVYSPEMLEYFRLEGITYNMASIAQSRAALQAAGFIGIEIRDRNDWYRELATREYASLSGEWYPTLVERLGEERARHFVINWRQLVLVLERGELRPAHLKARSP